MKKIDEQIEDREKKNRSGDNKRPRIPQSKFSRYTPFNVSRKQLLI